MDHAWTSSLVGVGDRTRLCHLRSLAGSHVSAALSRRANGRCGRVQDARNTNGSGNDTIEEDVDEIVVCVDSIADLCEPNGVNDKVSTHQVADPDGARRAQPKRITEADRVVAGVAVEVDAPGQPDGILGEQGPNVASYHRVASRATPEGATAHPTPCVPTSTPASPRSMPACW